MKTVIVIPARLESTRLPKKLLLRQTGQTLLEHTYHAASASRLADQILVAADHPSIVQAVEEFGGKAILTSPEHRCGTDRIAEVAANLHCDLVVNVQGDEPEIQASSIDLAIERLRDSPSSDVATLATPIRDRQQLEDPACVKVVFNQDGEAMYFSRSVIPHPRSWSDDLLTSEPANFWQHVGLYVYRRAFLATAAALSPPSIESLESLEQLRWIHAGFRIQVGLTDHFSIGIDTAEDYAAFVSRHSK